MIWDWYVWLGLGLLLFVFATFFTYIWWKVGDQWADAEYKKFGPRKARDDSAGLGEGAGPKVIRDVVTNDVGAEGDDQEVGAG